MTCMRKSATSDTNLQWVHLFVPGPWARNNDPLEVIRGQAIKQTWFNRSQVSSDPDLERVRGWGIVREAKGVWGEGVVSLDETWGKGIWRLHFQRQKDPESLTLGGNVNHITTPCIIGWLPLFQVKVLKNKAGSIWAKQLQQHVAIFRWLER